MDVMDTVSSLVIQLHTRLMNGAEKCMFNIQFIVRGGKKSRCCLTAPLTCLKSPFDVYAVNGLSRHSFLHALVPWYASVILELSLFSPHVLYCQRLRL